MLKSILKSTAAPAGSSRSREPGSPHRILKSFVFHIRPRMVAQRTLRFSLTFGLGGTAAVLVAQQIFTGVLLKFAYEPIPARAFDSLIRLQEGFVFGQLVRNTHFWSANLLVAVLCLHGLRVFFTGAFRPPRRANWIVGLSLFVLVLAANLTGYLLPWDQLAYWATTVSLGMLEYIPAGGVHLQHWVMGGERIGPATLRHFFALHTAVLPVLTVALMSYHFWRVRKAGGLVVPRSAQEAPEEKPAMVASNPDLLLREAAVALAVVGLVLTAALLFDAPLGAPANPGLSPNPTKAPWYFAGIQEMLMHFHPALAMLIVLALALAVFFIPPFLPGAALAPGVWFTSAVGRRSAAAGAAAAALLTPAAVVLDDRVVEFSAWLPGLPPVIRSGVVPAALFLAVLAGVYLLAKKGFRAPRAEAVQAVFAFLAVMFVALTLICAVFRGEGMALKWPGVG